jgi:hypothetical protein
MYPLAEAEVTDLFDDLVHSPDKDWDSVLSRIPALFGISEKASYLAYRSLGLPPTHALMAVGCTEQQLQEWLKDDDFAEVERHKIYDLQDRVSADIVKLGFMKNMALMIALDARVLLDATFSMETMSKRRYDYFMSVRKHYTPSDLLALDKVLHPADHASKPTIVLSWGNTEHVIEGVEAPYLIEGQVQGNDYPEFQHTGDEASEQANGL